MTKRPLETRITINKVVYKNDGWFVTRGVVDSESASIVGSLPLQTREGSHLLAEGTWETHVKFGKQFKVSAAIEELPDSLTALKGYLSSGAIKGIGPKTADRIIEAFGADTKHILSESPGRLLEISGIGEKTIQEVESTWGFNTLHREALIFFLEHDISAALANRIIKALGANSVSIIKENPYLILKTINRVGFKTVDAMAIKLGTEPNSKERICEGLLYSLEQGTNSGHIFLPEDDLTRQTTKILNLTETEVRQYLPEIKKESRCTYHNANYYLTSLYEQELQLTQSLKERLNTEARNVPTVVKKAKEVAQSTFPVHTSSGTQMSTLSSAQQEAVIKAASNQVLIITGGPGCGKTTVLKSLLTVFRYCGLATMLASPTGKAAQRMSEVTGMQASTIHRLLKFDPFNASFSQNSENPLNCDVLVVDESSMLDLSLACSLLEALPISSKLILVGDSDQLPSVGPGKVLLDLLESNTVPSVKLDTIFRQLESSSIVSVAHSINQAEVPFIPAPDEEMLQDAYFVECKDSESAAEMIELLVTDRIPNRFKATSDDILVLTPTKKGPLGSINVNSRLQKKFSSETSASLEQNGNRFLLGDRVCQNVNNYNIHKDGVFNGDQGYVVGIDTRNKEMTVKLWDGREIVYDSETIPQLGLAWALTVHKSQGSESPIVLLALHKSHHILLERQLFYTAVTRAKDKLFIVGERDAMFRAVRQTSGMKRNTTIKELMS